MFKRTHRILEARTAQIAMNQLCIEGGRPYVEARLWRAPNESNLSWGGSTTAFGTKQPGRSMRAALVADAQRVAFKLNDYIFSTDADREGAHPEFTKNCDGSGTPIRQFFEEVSLGVTSSRWCWMQVDRGYNDGERTIAERQADSLDRPHWTLWPATSVPDWHFSPDGRLGWLITAGMVYDNSDPYGDPKLVETRTLWRRDPGGCLWETYHEHVDEPVASGRLSIDVPPFVLVGEPSDKAWWMDNVEALQAQLMNLDSLHTENLIRSVFPQLVIPASMLDSVEVRLRERAGADGGTPTVEAIREVVRGLDSPFVERSEDKNLTRFLTPDAADLAAIPSEIDRKRAMLFENAGLSRFFSESRQIMSAEGQRLGLQDINATLKRRVLMLQEAENELVGLTAALDTEFQPYEARWNTDFDISDVEADAKVLVAVNQILRDPESDPEVSEKARQMLGQL